MTLPAGYRELACAVLKSAALIVQRGPVTRKKAGQAEAEYRDAVDFLAYGCRDTADPLAWHYLAGMEHLAELGRDKLVERLRSKHTPRRTGPRGPSPDLTGGQTVSLSEAARQLDRALVTVYQGLAALGVPRTNGRISLETVERLRGLFASRGAKGLPRRRQGLNRNLDTEHVEQAARRYASNSEAAAALGVALGSFGRACRLAGIETPRARRQRLQEAHRQAG